MVIENFMVIPNMPVYELWYAFRLRYQENSEFTKAMGKLASALR